MSDKEKEKEKEIMGAIINWRKAGYVVGIGCGGGEIEKERTMSDKEKEIIGALVKWRKTGYDVGIEDAAAEVEKFFKLNAADRAELMTNILNLKKEDLDVAVAKRKTK